MIFPSTKEGFLIREQVEVHEAFPAAATQVLRRQELAVVVRAKAQRLLRLLHVCARRVFKRQACKRTLQHCELRGNCERTYYSSQTTDAKRRSLVSLVANRLGLSPIYKSTKGETIVNNASE